MIMYPIRWTHQEDLGRVEIHGNGRIFLRARASDTSYIVPGYIRWEAIGHTMRGEGNKKKDRKHRNIKNRMV